MKYRIAYCNAILSLVIGSIGHTMEKYEADEDEPFFQRRNEASTPSNIHTPAACLPGTPPRQSNYMPSPLDGYQYPSNPWFDSFRGKKEFD